MGVVGPIHLFKIFNSPGDPLLSEALTLWLLDSGEMGSWGRGKCDRVVAWQGWGL